MVAKKPRVVIIGAGMSGLTAAHHLHSSLSADLFDIVVVEASNRIGGRILTSNLSDVRIEMGATWIQGIENSPLYSIAQQINSLVPQAPYERMDGHPSNPVTILEGGKVVDDELVVSPITNLYSQFMDAARSGEAVAVDDKNRGVGPFLRKGLEDYRGVMGNESFAAAEDAVFAMHVNEERVTTSADNIDELDLAAEAEYRDYPGAHITVPRGYSSIVEHLAASLPAGTILFGKRLCCVEWCPDRVMKLLGDAAGPVKLHFDGDGDGESFVMVADHVIITVSLGVLKAGLDGGGAGGLVFKPALPPAKRDAIRRLGFGVVDKVFIEVEEMEEDFPFVQLAFSTECTSDTPSWMSRTVSIFPVFRGSTILLAWIVGKEAIEMESLDDDEVMKGVYKTLDGFDLPSSASERGGGRTRVSRVKRSSWGKDPLFLGSYSYVAVGSSGHDMDVVAEPLPARIDDAIGGCTMLQVMFAGEATHRTHYSTTHGAYLSGIREASRLLKHYGLKLQHHQQLHHVCLD